MYRVFSYSKFPDEYVHHKIWESLKEYAAGTTVDIFKSDVPVYGISILSIYEWKYKNDIY